MRTLAIETATEACSIALFDGENLIANDHRVLGRGHAERLVPMLAELPDKGRAERILVSLGPGSFTGVRIGIATARALGVAWSAPVLGYPTLALVAAMAQARGARDVTVAMTGGHGEWFVGEFDDELGASDSFASLTPEAAHAKGAKGAIAGSQALTLGEMLGRDAASLHDILPDASCVMALPDRVWRTDLAPIYGRPPDAKPQAEKVDA